VIGLDASADMVFRARSMYDDVQLARMEDPLPDGPWDLVIGVLSIHHLTSEQKKNLFRQVRAQARSFVIGDVVKADAQIAPIDPSYDFPETAADLAEGCGGEVTWEADDLAVVRAVY
jgi:tRNA (cmo5U34)-methyltransferase